jgi:hypothetical protein
MIVLSGVAREVTTTSFADLVPITCTRVTVTPAGLVEVEFVSDLTTRQQWLVKIRCITTDAATEAMMISCIDAYPGLRQTRDSTGTLTGLQLSNAVRTLAATEIRIMRLLLGDVDTVAE